jgi:hypothetical protein
MAQMNQMNQMTQQTPEDRLARLEHENELLRLRLDRLEHEVSSMRAVVAQVKKLRLWDFTPYGVHPDESWVAVDRTSAAGLLAALAGVDHWEPWTTRIEPRTQK